MSRYFLILPAHLKRNVFMSSECEVCMVNAVFVFVWYFSSFFWVCWPCNPFCLKSLGAHLQRYMNVCPPVWIKYVQVIVNNMLLVCEIMTFENAAPSVCLWWHIYVNDHKVISFNQVPNGSTVPYFALWQVHILK